MSNNKDINRRAVLRSIGAAGAVPAMMGTASAASVEKKREKFKDIKIISDISRKKEKEMLAAAKSDDSVQAHISKAEESEYSHEDTKTHITKKGGSIVQKIVLFHYKKDDYSTNKEKIVYWMDISHNNISSTVDTDQLDTTGEVKIDHNEIEPSLNSTDGCNGDYDCGTNECCNEALECDSYNVDCIVGILLSSAALITGCVVSCMQPPGWITTACLTCFMAAVGGELTGIGCSPGEGCETVNNCAPVGTCLGS